jgi:hypothetical protein
VLTVSCVGKLAWRTSRKCTRDPQLENYVLARVPPVQALCDMGYSASDIITILFRVVRNFSGMNEYLKLEYIKVWQGPVVVW